VNSLELTKLARIHSDDTMYLQVIAPIALGGILAEDMPQLAAYEQRKRVGPVAEALEEVVGSSEKYDR
jgi:hypothetical protein